MGLWNNHRSRQAGKFAKKSYQLELSQVSAAQRQQHAERLAHNHYWFTQGWQASFGQQSAQAPDMAAYLCFMQGWDAARRTIGATQSLTVSSIGSGA